MMDKNYSKFNALDFSTDEYFLQWRMVADEESDRFWTNFIETHPSKKDEILSAIRIINSVQMNDYQFSQDELLTEWNHIHRSLKKSATRQRRLVYVLSIASSLVLLLLISYLLFFSKSDQHHYVTEITDQSAGKDIRLILPDESFVTFGEDADFIYDQEGNVTVSSAGKKELFPKKAIKGSSQLNKLTVPWGKISSLTLADGSKIWINSGTVLEFPSVFEEHQREIRVDGEIYIEVVQNEKSPFVVSTSGFSVNVLGTKFNVSAYHSDPVQRVVLVQGSVEVKMQTGKQLKLSTDEMFSLSGKDFHSEKVDVYDHISWKDGIFRFTRESLENILIRLSRHYDVPIACSNEVKKIHVTGKLALFDDLNTVLDNIAVIIPVKYAVENNSIIISKK
ncbi:MAG: FecR family protein [Mangrovibacterium sp.]